MFQVERQSFILGPSHVTALSETLTEKGITTKHLLMATSTGAIYDIPKHLLDPRSAHLLQNFLSACFFTTGKMSLDQAKRRLSVSLFLKVMVEGRLMSVRGFSPSLRLASYWRGSLIFLHSKTIFLPRVRSASDHTCLNPRRPNINTPADQREPGLPPYLPELQMPPEAILNYNQTVLSVKGITTGGWAIHLL